MALEERLTFYHLARFYNYSVSVVDEHVEAERLKDAALQDDDLVSVASIFLKQEMRPIDAITHIPKCSG